MEYDPPDRIVKKIESIWGSSGAWPDFILAMRQSLPGDARRADPEHDPLRWALLPGICCQAAGGNISWADDVAAAWFLFYLAAHVFDTIEDGDQPEEWWPDQGDGVALNIASGLLFSASLGLNALFSMQIGHPVKAEISAEFYKSILMMNSGQHRDLIARAPGLTDWMEIAEAKSGAFFSLACRAGARLATDDPARLDSFGQFGLCLGLLIQILDDLEDYFRIKGQSQGVFSSGITRSLPIAFARDVYPAEKLDHFEKSLEAATGDPELAKEVFQQIEASGAILFIQTEIECQHARARACLEAAAPEPKAKEILLGLLNKLSLA